MPFHVAVHKGSRGLTRISIKAMDAGELFSGEYKMSLTVTRATFDEVMVPNYAPAGFVPVKGLGPALGSGCHVEYLDFAGGIAVNSWGIAIRSLSRPSTEQAGKLWHVSMP